MIDAATTAKFEAILDMEQEVRLMSAVRGFQSAGTPLYRMEQARKTEQAAKDRLFAAIAALSPAEAKAFGQYRAEAAR